ncbi:DUF937 domain-containing protein [Thermaurantiacus sp.]
MDRLLDALGGNAGIAQMARELGVDAGTVQQGAMALLPALLGGFKKEAIRNGGLEGLLGMLGNLGGGSLLDAVLAPDSTPVEQGNAVLGRIFGSADVSRAVAQNAAGSTGLPVGLLKQMLPMLAMAAAGFMAKQAAAGTGSSSGGLIGQVIGALTGGAQGTGGLGGVARLLDFDGDGNPLDDILGMVAGGRR